MQQAQFIVFTNALTPGDSDKYIATRKQPGTSHYYAVTDITLAKSFSETEARGVADFLNGPPSETGNIPGVTGPRWMVARFTGP